MSTANPSACAACSLALHASGSAHVRSAAAAGCASRRHAALVRRSWPVLVGPSLAGQRSRQEQRNAAYGPRNTECKSVLGPSQGAVPAPSFYDTGPAVVGERNTDGKNRRCRPCRCARLRTPQWMPVCLGTRHEPPVARLTDALQMRRNRRGAIAALMLPASSAEKAMHQPPR